MVRLETLRLRMRPVQPRDLDSLSALNGDPHKMKYISPPLSRHQVQEALDWMLEEWHRIGYGWFAIFEKSSRAFVGQVGLQCFEYDSRSAETELAFVIKKSAWGRGYAREAAGEVLRFGFERHPFEKIVSVIAPENLGNLRLMPPLLLVIRNLCLQGKAPDEVSQNIEDVTEVLTEALEEFHR